MSSTAIITPQPDGSAIFELNGITHRFDSYQEAQNEVDARRISSIVEPFPNPGHGDPVTARQPAAMG